MTDVLSATSPSAADSPTTPVNVNNLDIKIDIEYVEESDARHEPLPVKLASNFPELGTPINPDVIPIEPPKGTPPPPTGQLLEDVRMAEQESPLEESKMDEEDMDMEDTPAVDDRELPKVEAPKDEEARVDDNDHDVEDQPRPAKRARKSSNADEESMISNPTNGATTPNGILSPEEQPPASSPSSSSTGTALTQAQFKFCLSSLRQVKKSKDAKPFLYPVDWVAMNIPHYPSIVTHPMDLSTVERKLTCSNPAKPDPNPNTPKYTTADEFVADVRLVFSNCVTFNGPDHQITHMGKRVEELFDKSLKNMPGPEEAKPPVIKKVHVQAVAPPPPPPVVVAAPPKRAANPPARRASASSPAIRRNDADGPAARPKREIHPPASKDLPYTEVPKKRKGRMSKDNVNAKQLEFCSKLLQDLHRKTHWAIASPFYEPVDWVLLELPNYPKVVKKPMDLSTMRKRLDNGEYPSPTRFFEDFKLMIRNCFLFNPPGTPVNQAGIDLQRLFDDKWKSLPQASSLPTTQDWDDEGAEDTEEERERIAEMEREIEQMRGSITALKNRTSSKKVKKPAQQSYKPPVPASSSARPRASASTSKAPAKHADAPPKKKPVPGRKSGGGASGTTDDDVLTFEQKKDLSEAIGGLDGAKLEKVVQIIHEGVPEIRDSTEEIELEIDLLPAHVLTKLYNFVIRPSLRTAAPKRSRTGKGTGTGGLKRKSMDEEVEAEKIRQLEARMALFENPDGSGLPAAAGGEAGVAGNGNASGSSDSSDGSDSSGSESE